MTDADLDAMLDAVWESVAHIADERLAVLQEYAERLRSGTPPDEAARRHAEWEAHKLVGSLGSYHRPGSEVAKALELQLRDGADAQRVADLVAELAVQLTPVLPGTGRRLLIVTDDPPTRRRLHATLAAHSGFLVRTVSDSGAAVAAACDGTDVVVLDALLQSGDSSRLVFALRSDPRSAGLAVVLVAPVPDDPRWSTLPVTAVVKSPQDPADFIRAVVAADRAARDAG